MNYEIYYTKKALKDLKKYKKKNNKEYSKLKEDIEKLETNPYKTENINIKSSKCPRCKRMKSGNYRIIYVIHSKNHEVEIVKVIERKKDYREF